MCAGPDPPSPAPAKLEAISSAYLQLWAALQWSEWAVGALTLSSPWHLLQLFLCSLTALSPSRTPVAAAALVCRTLNLCVNVPFAWDAEYLEALTNLSVILILWRSEPLSRRLADVCFTIRWQLGLFYFSAALWKLNTAFLHPSYSCGSTYIAQIIDAHAPYIPEPIAIAAVRAGAILTLLGEGAIGVLAPVAPATGAGLGLLLHLGIALTPFPNNIANFGIACAVRYFWLIPAGATAAIAEVRGPWAAVHVAAGAAIVAITSAASAAAAAAAASPSSSSSFSSSSAAAAAAVPSSISAAFETADWVAGIYASVCSLLLRALLLELRLRADSTQRLPRRPPSRGASVLLAYTFCWAYLAIPLGLLDASSPNMFSNLRMAGGSNHYLLPTGLLQRVYADAGPASAFAGGVVRVEASTSAFINDRHPADFSDSLTAGARRLLRRAGHSGRHWNAAVANIVGPFVLPPRPKAGPFTRYTVPAYELRRLLRGARAAGEAFRLVYTELGAVGDETWRREGGGRTVELVEDGVGGRRCSVKAGRGWAPCNGSEIGMWAEPSALSVLNWLAIAQVWNSYVILPDVEVPAAGGAIELHCYGS